MTCKRPTFSNQPGVDNARLRREMQSAVEYLCAQLDRLDASQTAAEAAAITDHGGLGGLTDDDHTQYLLADGSRNGATAGEQEFENRGYFSAGGVYAGGTTNACVYVDTTLTQPGVRIDKGAANNRSLFDFFSGSRAWILQHDSGENLNWLRYVTGNLQDTAWSISNATGLVSIANDLDVAGSIDTGEHLDVDEQVSAASPGAGVGRFWVRNNSPNRPMFTDDGGTAYNLLDRLTIHYSRLTGDNGAGSTNTNVARWDTESESGGSHVTYTDSATNGGYWTVNADGIYSVSMSCASAGTTAIGIHVGTLNNTEVAATLRARSNFADVVESISWTGFIASGDDVWGTVTGTALSVSSVSNQMSIARVA